MYHIVIFLTECYDSTAMVILGRTSASIGGGGVNWERGVIFIYSCSARLISFEISCF